MRALISVSNKEGIIAFAKELEKWGVEIISTGGTYDALSNAGIQVISVSDVTKFPEMLDGRVKTLHPAIHGGILAVRSNQQHMDRIHEMNIQPIDLVIVNLYPFKETILKENVTREAAIENIDIGGPSMLRAAAKNYESVAVVCDPHDYEKLLRELKEKNEISIETKLYLCAKVFQHTAHYDSLIADYITKEAGIDGFTDTISLTYEKIADMRYGENPHQKAAFYKEATAGAGTLCNAKQLHGKELSFNNINDANGALELLKEFTDPTVVAVKHANPCGVGSAETIYDAYMKAYTADNVSIFGGIVVANREIDEKTAEEINKIFIEIIAAPSYSEKALEILKQKKNIRVLEIKHIERKETRGYDLKKVSGGILIQETDSIRTPESYKVVTKRKPTEKEMEDLLFMFKIVKYVKSNGIAIGKNKQTVGVGPGQVNRIWACKQAIEHGNEFLGADYVKGSVLASDAFFPFDDSVEEAAKAGVTAIIQPGGSIRDEDSIKKCDQYGIAMVFTGVRHFRH